MLLLAEGADALRAVQGMEKPEGVCQGWHGAIHPTVLRASLWDVMGRAFHLTRSTL